LAQLRGLKMPENEEKTGGRESDETVR